MRSMRFVAIALVASVLFAPLPFARGAQVNASAEDSALLAQLLQSIEQLVRQLAALLSQVRLFNTGVKGFTPITTKITTPPPAPAEPVSPSAPANVAPPPPVQQTSPLPAVSPRISQAPRTSVPPVLQLTARDNGAILTKVKNETAQDVLYQVLASKTLTGKKSKLTEYANQIRNFDNDQAYAAVQRLYAARNQFPAMLQDQMPKRINFKDYFLRIEHGETYQNNRVSESTFRLYLREEINTRNAKEFPILIAGDINRLRNLLQPENYRSQEGFLYGNTVYTKISEGGTVGASRSPSVIQGRTTSQPSNTPSASRAATAAPFNWTSRNVLVLLPYNHSAPLTNFSAVSAYLTQRFRAVRQFFLDNSENNFDLMFQSVPVFPIPVLVNSLYPLDIFGVLAAADPYVNYSNFDFVTIVANGSSGVGLPGNYASMAWNYSANPPTPVYYPTNEPIASAVAVVSLVDAPNYPPGYTEHLIEHEIGHVLSFWNPQLQPTQQFFFGFVPHASSLYFSSCSPSGFSVVCNAEEYGDRYEVMGVGRGSLSHHQAVNRAGLRSSLKTQTVNSSGTYSLCDINHSTTSCPQELLLDNPNGVNISIELRTPSGSDTVWSTIGCASFLDGLIVRATDIKEGGGLGNSTYQYLFSSGIYGGDIVLPQSFNSTLCLSSPVNPLGNMYDVPVLPGQTMQTPLGNITLQALTPLANGGRQATVVLSNYTVPPCVSNPPTVTGLPALIQIYNNSGLWPVNQFDYPFISITNNDICNTGPEAFQLGIEVNVAGVLHSAQVFVDVSPSLFNGISLPIPPTLVGVTGTYPYTVTATKVSNPSQTAVLTGTISLEKYAPQVFGPYGVSSCTDHDAIPFTLQNLGANYVSNAGGTITLEPPVLGIPPNFSGPDICFSSGLTIPSISAADLVCGSNTGIPSIANQVFSIVQDCRFILNTPYAACSLGACTPYP